MHHRRRAVPRLGTLRGRAGLAAFRRKDSEPPMADLAMIAITLVFFLLAWLYVRACERV